MSQHDYTIDSSSGAAVRADINAALQAGQSQNSGAAAPATTFAGQEYIDTALGMLMRRNQGNTLSFPVDNADYVRYASKTTAYTITTADMAKLVEGNTTSAGFTLTLPGNASVSAAGGGWWCLIRSSGTSGNVLTINPNGSELINGAANIQIADGESVLIFSTGTTNWRALFFVYRPDLDTLRLRSNQPALELYESDTAQRFALQVNGSYCNIRDVTAAKNIARFQGGAPDGSLIVEADGTTHLTAAGVEPLAVNRGTDDGDLVVFQRAGTPVGSISVTAGTVSYGAFLAHHPSQWASGEAPAEDPPVGTLVETVDEACEYREIHVQEWTQDERGRRRAFDRWAVTPYTGSEKPGAQGKRRHTYRDPVTEQLVMIELGWRVTHRIEARLPRVRVCNVSLSRRVYGVFAGRQPNGDLIIHALGAGQALVTGPAAGGDLLVAAGDGTVRALQEGDELPSWRLAACIVGRVTIGDVETGPRLVPCVLSCG